MTQTRSRSGLALLSVILPYLRRERRHYVLAIALLPVAVLLPIAPPWIIHRIVDGGHWTSLSRGLLLMAALLVALVAANFGIQYLFQRILRTIGLRIMRELRADLFDRIERFPLAFFRHEQKGRIVSRLTTDLEQIDQMFASGGVMLLSDILGVVALGGAMLLLDWRLGLWGLAIIPAMIVATLWIGDGMRRIQREVRRLLAVMNGFSQEAFSAHELIGTLGAEREFARRFDGLARDYERTTVVSNMYEASFFAGVDLFSAVAAALVILGASGMGVVQAGLLIAMTQYVQQFFIPLRGLSTRYATYQQAMVALERVDHFFRLPVEPAEVADEMPRARRDARSLAINDLHFSYDGNREVLRGVTLAIPAGEHLALLGETGSGKSTLARLLTGLYPIDGGGLRWGDEDLIAMPLSRRRSLVLLVPQEVFLFDTGILENITLGRDSDPAAVRAAMLAVGLDAFLDDGAIGAERLGEWGRRLSEGEKQLIAAARVLVLDPACVILDEATSALDPLSDALVRAAIRTALAGRSAIIIAHRLSTLESADRAAVMKDGAIVESGSHRSLLASGGYYARLYRLMELGDLALGGSPVTAEAVPAYIAHHDNLVAEQE
jgi:ATP-binding cassette subfamily B protein